MKTEKVRKMAIRINISKMEQSCDEVCRILKALSHPDRLMVMGHLLTGPKSVSELVELCGISQSQMSQFLTRMSIEGLIKAERQGKFRLYSIADSRLVQLLKILTVQYCQG